MRTPALILCYDAYILVYILMRNNYQHHHRRRHRDAR